MLFFNSKKKQVNLPSKIPLRNTIQGIIAITSCKGGTGESYTEHTLVQLLSMWKIIMLSPFKSGAAANLPMQGLQGTIYICSRRAQ